MTAKSLSCFCRTYCVNGQHFMSLTMYSRFQSLSCNTCPPYFKMSMSILTMLFARAPFRLPHIFSICFTALTTCSSLCEVWVNARQFRNGSDSMPIGVVHICSVKTMSLPNISRSRDIASDIHVSWSQLLPRDIISSFLSVMAVLPVFPQQKFFGLFQVVRCVDAYCFDICYADFYPVSVLQPSQLFQAFGYFQA